MALLHVCCNRNIIIDNNKKLSSSCTCRTSFVIPEQHLLCIPIKPTMFAVSSDKAKEIFFFATCSCYPSSTYLLFVWVVQVRDMPDGSARWIAKPSITNQATGICIFDRVSQLEAALHANQDLREWVLQRWGMPESTCTSEILALIWPHLAAPDWFRQLPLNHEHND